jgi:hypothetical protein
MFFPGSADRKVLLVPSRKVAEPFTETRVRRVCRGCNNGWMAQLEERVQPVLTSMIKGQSVRLETSDVAAIATWATKTAMMHEFTDTGSQAYEQRDHHWLRDRREPPKGTAVWAGAMMSFGDWALRAEHAGLLYRELPTTDVNDPCNTSQTTIGLGYLLLTVVHSRVEAMNRQLDFSWAGGAMVKLWPPPETVKWPLELTIPNELAWAIGTFLAFLVSA